MLPPGGQSLYISPTQRMMALLPFFTISHSDLSQNCSVSTSHYVPRACGIVNCLPVERYHFNCPLPPARWLIKIHLLTEFPQFQFINSTLIHEDTSQKRETMANNKPILETITNKGLRSSIQQLEVSVTRQMTKTDELEDTFAIQMARTERLCMLVEKVLHCSSSSSKNSNMSNHVRGRRGSISTVSTASSSSVEEEEEEEEIDKDSVDEDITWRTLRTSRRRRGSVGVDSTYTATTTTVDDSCSLILDSVVEDESSSSMYTTSVKTTTTSSTVEALSFTTVINL